MKGLERSLREDRPRALIQMATGSGKTITAITAAYRLIKHGGARRVLFLLVRILAERKLRWEKSERAKMKARGIIPKDDRWKAKYEEPAAPDESGLPELPEGWCCASVEQLVLHLTSGSRDWSPFYGRGTSVFIMAQNVRPGKLDLSFKQFVDPPVDDPSRERSQVALGDLLVTIVGANTGQVCAVRNDLPEHFVCQSVALLRPVDQSCSRYLDLFLNSVSGQRQFQEFMYGEGRPHLSFVDLRSTRIPLPPIVEQARIVEAVEEGISRTDASLNLQESFAHIARLRQSILKWAFEGKLVDQDPNDEPAAEMLARIRAGREGNAGAARGKVRGRPQKPRG